MDLEHTAAATSDSDAASGVGGEQKNPQFRDVEAGTHSSKRRKLIAGEGFSTDSSAAEKLNLAAGVKAEKRKWKKKGERSERAAEKLDRRGTNALGTLAKFYQEKLEYEILMRDTTNMKPGLLETHQWFVDRILEKKGN